MELRHLAHFVTVAEEGNFTRAARRLHIVQSGLSSSIRSFEHELGVELFDRSTQPVELTAAGRALLAHARRTLAAADATRAAAEDLRSAVTGPLLIGVMQWMQPVGLARCVQTFRRAHPAVEVQLHQSGSRNLAERVRRQELDLAFVSLAEPAPPGLTLVPVIAEPLVLASPTGHPLAGREAVALAELADEPFVDFHADWGIRGIIDRAFAAQGIERRSVCQVNDISHILDLVENGLGVALVPESATHRSPGVAIATVDDPRLTRRIDLAVPAEGAHSPAARRFLAYGPSGVRNVPRHPQSLDEPGPAPSSG